MPCTKKWVNYAEGAMDQFIETGDPNHLMKFLSLFFCEHCRGECLCCAAHKSTGLYNHLSICTELMGPLEQGCAILHCLNSCMSSTFHARFCIERSVGNMSSINLKWNGYSNIASVPFDKMMSRFNHAKFLFMFLPVWEHMKEQEGRANAS